MSDRDIEGNDGPNTLRGTAFADDIRGRGGDDILLGLGGDDSLRGDEGNDRLDGGIGADRLRGDEGNDTLFGGEGNDRLRGDRGDDELTGGAGRDRFIFSPRGGDDTVTDFQDGQDRIDLSNFGFATLDDALATAEQAGADTVFTIGDVTITLQGVTLGALDQGDLLI